MNNLRNLGRAFLVYSDQNKGYVPEEGNIGVTVLNSANASAWYNLAVLPQYPALKSLYNAGYVTNAPLPGNGTIFSCPAAPLPSAGQPSLSWALFMYGENNWLCVNASTRTTLGQSVQTRFQTIAKPAATVMIGEVNDDYAFNSSTPALSGTTAPYAATRHDGFGQFTMCDGSVRLLTTNEFFHPQSSAAQEWYSNGSNPSGGYTSWPVYWWPTPTTPN